MADENEAISKWESQTFEKWLTNDDEIDKGRIQENEQKLWCLFQISASNIACMYKESSSPDASYQKRWTAFRSAASSITDLYREALDQTRKMKESAIERGSRRKVREILNWLRRKKRNHIRREDLFAVLCDQKPPSRLSVSQDSPADLTPFRDALLLQRLNGAMSHMGVEAGSQNVGDEFQTVLLEDLSRHISDSNKRTAPASANNSPNARKKSRLH